MHGLPGSPPRATAPASTEPVAMPTCDRRRPNQHQRFPRRRYNRGEHNQSRGSDGRSVAPNEREHRTGGAEREFRRAVLYVWTGADQSAAAVRTAAPIGCRIASNCADVNDFCPHAILAGDTILNPVNCSDPDRASASLSGTPRKPDFIVCRKWTGSWGSIDSALTQWQRLKEASDETLQRATGAIRPQRVSVFSGSVHARRGRNSPE